MDAATFREVLQRLRPRYAPSNWAEGRDPFEVLVAVVVSQNSTDAVTERVMARLREVAEVTPGGFLETPGAEVEDVLRPAGLAPQKVPRLRAVARTLVTRYGGTMDAFLEMPEEDARRALLDLPGVGPKTADVWLNLVADRPTMPVDTHIARLARRWKLTSSRRYEDLAAALRACIPPEDRRWAHLALIAFGREVCQARRPRCERCPVYDRCDAEVKRPRPGGSVRGSADASPGPGRGGRGPRRP